MILLSIIVGIVIFIITESFSAFIASLIVAGIGNLSILILNAKYRKRAARLFNIVFVIYSFFAIAHYVNYAYYGKLMYIDENYFVTLAEDLTIGSESIKDTYKISFDEDLLVDNRGYVFYITSIVTLAKQYLGAYNIYILFLSSLLLGSLSSILLFRLLLFHIPDKEAFRYTLLFAIFSPLLLYSYVVLRDIVITFLFLTAFVIVHKNFSVKSLLLLIILNFITFYFRTEHGIVFMLFIAYYSYKEFRSNKIILYSSIIVITMSLSTFFLTSYNKILYTAERYTEFTHYDVMSKGGDSIGAALYSLPTPIKEFLQFFYSLMTPFPSWIGVETATNIYEGITSLSPIFYSFYWFTIAFGILKWFVIKRKHKQISKDLKLLFYIASFLYMGNLVSFNIRRIMFVYPIIYLVYAVINTKVINKKQVNNTIIQSTTIYLSLIVFYIVLKSNVF